MKTPQGIIIVGAPERKIWNSFSRLFGDDAGARK